MTAMLDIDQLRTFIAISETGSFTKAAEVVNKTQSAVSMQMKRLEERLERPIFSRDGRASKLTEDGQRLLYRFGGPGLAEQCLLRFAGARGHGGDARVGQPGVAHDAVCVQIHSETGRHGANVHLAAFGNLVPLAAARDGGLRREAGHDDGFQDLARLEGGLAVSHEEFTDGQRPLAKR